jgi:hypothetical protein
MLLDVSCGTIPGEVGQTLSRRLGGAYSSDRAATARGRSGDKDCCRARKATHARRTPEWAFRPWNANAYGSCGQILDLRPNACVQAVYVILWGADECHRSQRGGPFTSCKTSAGPPLLCVLVFEAAGFDPVLVMEVGSGKLPRLMTSPRPWIEAIAGLADEGSFYLRHGLLAGQSRIVRRIWRRTGELATALPCLAETGWHAGAVSRKSRQNVPVRRGTVATPQQLRVSTQRRSARELPASRDKSDGATRWAPGSCGLPREW